MSTYNAIATNKTNNDYSINTLYVTITIGDDDIKTIALSDITIKPNESKNITVSFDRDLSKLTKITYEINK